MATIKKVTVTAKALDGFLIETRAGDHIALVDQPEKMGETNKGPTPLDYVFVALAGCLATIAKIVAMQKQIDLRGFEVSVEGEYNLDVIRGKDRSDRAGFNSIKVNIKIDADMSQEEKQAFIDEVDRRCPVSDNLINTTPVEIVVE